MQWQGAQQKDHLIIPQTSTCTQYNTCYIIPNSAYVLTCDFFGGALPSPPLQAFWGFLGLLPVIPHSSGIAWWWSCCCCCCCCCCFFLFCNLSEYRDFPVGTVCQKLEKNIINTCTNITLQERDNGTEEHKSLVHMFLNKNKCKTWAKTTIRNSSNLKMHES